MSPCPSIPRSGEEHSPQALEGLYVEAGRECETPYCERPASNPVQRTDLRVLYFIAGRAAPCLSCRGS